MLIVGIPPLGSGFFQTGVRRRKYKLGPTKKFPVQIFASLARVYISSSSPQSERIRTPGGVPTIRFSPCFKRPRTPLFCRSQPRARRGYYPLSSDPRPAAPAPASAPRAERDQTQPVASVVQSSCNFVRGCRGGTGSSALSPAGERADAGARTATRSA